jgi:hypothetical protein
LLEEGGKLPDEEEGETTTELTKSKTWLYGKNITEPKKNNNNNGG